jgi:hypothetical protein
VLAAVVIHGIWESAAALGGEAFAVLILRADTIFSVTAIRARPLPLGDRPAAR